MVRGKVGWDTDTLGDFVVLRSNGMPVYNFCVAVDDATMGITTQAKAEGALAEHASPGARVQRPGFPLPTFAHMSSFAPDRPSSPSATARRPSVSSRRRATSARRWSTTSLCWAGTTAPSKKFTKREELENLFSVERINKSPAVFDKVKLNWMNGQHLRLLSGFRRRISRRQRARSFGRVSESTGPTVQAIIPLIKDSIELVEDAVPQVEAMFDYPLKENMSDDAMKKVLEDDFEPIVKPLSRHTRAVNSPPPSRKAR